MAGSNGNQYRTFVGPGFGTLQHQTAPESRGIPPIISRRATLRHAMPSIYHETDFAMRFVGALEHLLDPIAAVLDALPQHFSPDYAPEPIIDMMSAWLGAEIDEAQELGARRENVRMAAELGRRRGTVRGLEMALKLNFPEIPMRIDDAGGVGWSLDGTLGQAGAESFVVYVDIPIPEDRQVAIARCIEHHKPVQTTYRLRIKAPPKKASE